jgi:hypothetical protein
MIMSVRAFVFILCLLSLCISQTACISVSTPAEVPAGVLAVLEDPGSVDVTNHPLAAVTPGTVVDDLAGVAGCWAAYEVTESYDGLSEMRTVSVIIFEAGPMRVTRQVWHYDSYTNTADIVLSWGSYSMEGDSRMIVSMTQAEAGIVAADGTIVPDPPTQNTLAALLLWMPLLGADCPRSPDGGYAQTWRATLAGDYLVTEALDCFLIEGGSGGNPKTFWTRIECPD